MEYKTKPEKVSVRTVEGIMITGQVNLATKERLSDVFTRDNKPFVILYDAIFEDSVEDVRKVLFINKSHIVWAEPV